MHHLLVCPGSLGRVSVVPPGLGSCLARLPALKCWARFTASLRDGKLVSLGRSDHLVAREQRLVVRAGRRRTCAFVPTSHCSLATSHCLQRRRAHDRAPCRSSRRSCCRCCHCSSGCASSPSIIASFAWVAASFGFKVRTC